MPLSSLNPKEIFIGGVPKERTEIIEESQSKKDFVGCLDDVVINHVSFVYLSSMNIRYIVITCNSQVTKQSY